jgi:predicted alpha/beta hydrolase
MIDYALAELGARAVAVVGHSAGGQIIGLAGNNTHLSAVLLVAAQGGHWRLWPAGLSRARMMLYMYCALPLLARTIGYVPRAVLGADVPGSIIREWARWCRTEDYLLGGEEGASRRPGYERLRVPLLALSFEGDFYAPRAAVEWLLRQYGSATVTHRHFTAKDIDASLVDHFAFFRPAAETTLWRYAATWLEAQLP